MSKRQLKSQASSGRVAGFGKLTLGSGFGSSTEAFGSASSALSYLAEQPDLSTVSDSNVVVHFRNLAKKDSTTKTKALDELLSYANSQREALADIEEGILSAWIKMYPRTSIDGDRRVRQLAHTTHGSVLAGSGRKAAKYMSSCIGAWLAGCHDGDRSVGRNALESFTTVFPTAEKRESLKKIYQMQIIDFCRNALLEETPKSLSDERSTKDDEAEAKYARLVSSSLSALKSLIETLDRAELKKQESRYTEIWTSQKVWNLSASVDSHVRRSLYKFAQIGVKKLSDHDNIEVSPLVSALLSKHVIRRQTGSALEYSDTLVVICSLHRSVWLALFKSPATGLKQVADLIEQGSQGASGTYWSNIARLFSTIPLNLLPTTPDEVIRILDALQVGITRKEEPRSNAEDAWACYVSVLELLNLRLSPDHQSQTHSKMVLPILSRYLDADREGLLWNLPAIQSMEIIVKLLKIPNLLDLVHSSWLSWTDTFADEIRLLGTQISSGFETSQINVARKGVRWFELQDKILALDQSSDRRHFYDLTTNRVLTESFKTLERDNGKAFGAAQVIHSAFRLGGQQLFDIAETRDLINGFLVSVLPYLMFSPSRPYLFSILYASKRSMHFVESWEKVVSIILSASEPTERLMAMEELLEASGTVEDFRRMQENDDLQHFFSNIIDELTSSPSSWSTIFPILTKSTSALSSVNVENLMAALADGLTLESKASKALSGLELLANDKPQILQAFMEIPPGSQMMQNVLLLIDSPNDILSNQATELQSKLLSVLSLEQNSSIDGIYGLILKGLYNVGQQSIAIETLIDLARQEQRGDKESLPILAQQILSNTGKWTEALQPFLEESIPHSMATASTLGALSFLISFAPSEPKLAHASIYDRDGYTAPVRMALFTFHFVLDSKLWSAIHIGDQANIYRLLLLTAQLLNDSLTMSGSSSICKLHNAQAKNEMTAFIFGVDKLFALWYNSCTEDVLLGDSFLKETHSFLAHAHKHLRQACKEVSAISYHSARALSRSLSEIIEVRGWQAKISSYMIDSLQNVRSPESLEIIALVTGFEAPLSNSPLYTKVCNELVADLTGSDIASDTNKILRHLILLNIMLQNHEEVLIAVAKQRLIFFVKRIIVWFSTGPENVFVRTEVAKTLSLLLPSIKEVYGDHWSEILKCTGAICRGVLPAREGFAQSGHVPLLYYSLKLVSKIRQIALDGECNDDLKEAWHNSTELTATTLLTLLGQMGQLTDTRNHPLRSTNELIGRLIRMFPVTQFGDLDGIYHLIAANSQPVQYTAFQMFHKKIPAMQVKISVDVALDKSAARVPDELLSLVLEAPTVESLAKKGLESEMYLPLRAYLSAWLLIFDHFKNAVMLHNITFEYMLTHHKSDKVRNDYITHLKEEDCLQVLLHLTFDCLGHSQGNPVDASKFDMTIYSFDVHEDPTLDMQWLLVHLYYLCLKSTPSLVKSWWMQCKSRQLVINVESWTERYISSQMISDALDTVNAWASAQDNATDDSLEIKTNVRAKEIILSKELDSQILAMAIRLPGNYPLGLVTCASINRVAVEPKKWQTWLMNTQGVIAFSNNSLIDGIVAFRRNVNGTLKGQTECAICYSIVGADKQLPTKKCGTCKNLFHGNCLYRWFKSSNSSSCPLCRNAFNYT